MNIQNYPSNDIDNMVSIIVPFRNHQKVIERCVRSIVNQDYDLMEVIFVNDGSTDNSESIIKDTMYNSNIDYRIYNVNGPFASKDGGINYTIMHGIISSRGQFTFICYPSGYIPSNFISTLSILIGDFAAILPLRLRVSGGLARVLTKGINDNMYSAIVEDKCDIQWVYGNYFFRKYDYIKNFCYILGSIPIEYLLQLGMFCSSDVPYVTTVPYIESDEGYYDPENNGSRYMCTYSNLDHYLDVLYARTRWRFLGRDCALPNPARLYTICDRNSIMTSTYGSRLAIPDCIERHK